jgi:endonuclease/exonuclease/phosphatase family metal-dependent hydrolase
MKTLLRSVLAIAATILLVPAHTMAAAAQQDAPLDVMTFNIRYAHTTPPNLWPDRRPVMRELIERWAPDVIGLQEALYSQLLDMEQDLPGYGWIGLGREGGSRGEFMAVLYLRDRLTPIEFDHYWLSDTPEVIGSRTWGNQNHRMVTWVRFRDRETEREVYVINTHFDHQVQEARERSAELLLERARQFEPNVPVVLLGDFNVDAGANPVYYRLTAPDAFVDSWTALGHEEPGFGTFHGFRGAEGAAGRARIDWVLTRGALRPVSSEIVTFSRDGQYPSDHYPVVARLVFE